MHKNTHQIPNIIQVRSWGISHDLSEPQARKVLKELKVIVVKIKGTSWVDKQIADEYFMLYFYNKGLETKQAQIRAKKRAAAQKESQIGIYKPRK